MRFEIKDGAYKSSVLVVICSGFNLTQQDVCSKSRLPILVMCRTMVCKLLRDNGEKIESISLVINRDHSSVIHLLKRHDDYMSNESYKEFYERLSANQINLGIIKQIQYHQDKTAELYKLLL